MIGILTYFFYSYALQRKPKYMYIIIMNTRQMMKGDTYINQRFNFSDFSYRTKLSRLAFLANRLGTLLRRTLLALAL